MHRRRFAEEGRGVGERQGMTDALFAAETQVQGSVRVLETRK
jgi:hypothetical protein